MLSCAPWHATGKEKPRLGAETKLFSKPLKNSRSERLDFYRKHHTQGPDKLYIQEKLTLFILANSPKSLS